MRGRSYDIRLNRNLNTTGSRENINVKVKNF